ncbi:hypothetical protein [Carnobacterium divergens]|uniref:Uncharacterized protein n=1 Tax=Carnobacterium divergens TaxID=2748 RepID=A0AAW8RGZ9_CARDV|nr:hypothetical protein [Carnobacterium divergens]MDT1958958.1 hypothetical protein [Carnobacterium divergens]MDT1974926.1 hypothetical protein [Carnobacterium divergens]MDT2012890.1 hypothetical protein [Carnobacterium divergens]
MNQLKVQIENYKKTWKEPGYKKIKMYTLICWLEKIMKYIAGMGGMALSIWSCKNLYSMFIMEIKQSLFLMLDPSKQEEFTKFLEDIGANFSAFVAIVFFLLMLINCLQFMAPTVGFNGSFLRDKVTIEKPNFRVKETRTIESEYKSLRIRRIVICFVGISLVMIPFNEVFPRKLSYFVVFAVLSFLIFQGVKRFILLRLAKEFQYGLELLTTEKDFLRLDQRIGSILKLPTYYLPFLKESHVQLTHELIKPPADNQGLSNEEDNEKDTESLVYCKFMKEYQFIFSPIRVQYELPIYYFKNKITLENHENSLKEFIGDTNYKKLGCFVYLKDKPK